MALANRLYSVYGSIMFAGGRQAALSGVIVMAALLGWLRTAHGQ
jgi:hypothetical protein